METQESNSGKDSKPQREIIKISKLQIGSVTLKNVQISVIKTPFGESFGLFIGENKLMFCNENTRLGKQLNEVYDQIEKTEFNLTLDVFEGNYNDRYYKSASILKITKIKDVVHEIEDKQITLEGF